MSNIKPSKILEIINYSSLTATCLVLFLLIFLSTDHDRSYAKSTTENSVRKISEPRLVDSDAKVVGEKKDFVPLSTPPLTDNIFAALVEGHGYILADIGPEIVKFDQHSPNIIAEYLQRRALQMILEKRKAEGAWQGISSYLVRFIVVASTNEYNQPQWAAAPEAANFMFTSIPADIDPQTISRDKIEAMLENSTIRFSAFNKLRD